MTKLKYKRWKDFALRMALTCYQNSRRPSGAWVAEVVESFFDGLDKDEIKDIVDWDNTEGETYCVSDMMTEFFDSYEGSPDRCRACRDRSVIGPRDKCRCWEIRDRYHEQWQEQWGGPVRCCIRAGLDTASAPSMGVMGFTAGDIRKMYPEGVPDWVTGGKEHRWTTQHFDGVIPGVGLLPGKTELNGTFAEMPDEAAVWL